jgi:hypothetical protein
MSWTDHLKSLKDLVIESEPDPTPTSFTAIQSNVPLAGPPCRM